MADPFAGIKKAFGIFEEIGNRMSRLKVDFEQIGSGIKHEIEGVGEGLIIGTSDITHLVEYTFVFVGSYIQCGVHFLQNFKTCFLYYFVEIIGQILYSPVRLVIFIIYICGFGNMQPHVDGLWMYADKLDSYVYNYGKFHIIHYPKSIREKCYVCKRLKKEVLARQANKVKRDFEPDGDIAQVFNQGINEIKEAGSDMKHVFTDPF